MAKKLSGHGDSFRRKLSQQQIKDVRAGKPVYITMSGEKKKVTPSNIRMGRVEGYKRSDTKKIALRRFTSDDKRPSKNRGKGWRRQFEHD